MNSVLKLKEKDKDFAKAIEFLKKHIDKTPYASKVYAVGGFVRDAILSRTPNDINLAVSLSNGGFLLAHNLWTRGLTVDKPKPNEDDGTTSFSLKSVPNIIFNATQTRRKNFVKGMESEVGIFGTVEADAMLRDLTINSLYYNITTDKIIDPTAKGMMDIFQHRVRTVISPDEAFTVSPIRMFRTLRIANALLWNIEKATWFGIISNAVLAKTISLPRFNLELINILSLPRPSISLYKMYYSGLLEYVLQDFDAMMDINDPRTPKKTLYSHTLEVVDKTTPTDIIARYAAFFHDYGKLIPPIFFNIKNNPIDTTLEFVPDLMRQMGFSDELNNRIINVIKYHEFFDGCSRDETPSTKQVRRFMTLLGDDMISCLDVMNANNLSVSVRSNPLLVKRVLEKIDEIRESDSKRHSRASLPISGKEIIDRFDIKDGWLVGEIICELAKQLDENPEISKEECIRFVDRYIHKLAM